jgi:hypothetical protein
MRQFPVEMPPYTGGIFVAERSGSYSDGFYVQLLGVQARAQTGKLVRDLARDGFCVYALQPFEQLFDGGLFAHKARLDRNTALSGLVNNLIHEFDGWLKQNRLKFFDEYTDPETAECRRAIE